MDIHALPAFSDNYIWCFGTGGRACVVDPGDAAPVLRHLQQHGLQLETILVTHHHFDHVGGVAELKQATGCVVYGPDNPAIDAIDHRLHAGDSIRVLGRTFTVLAVPGHTLDHIAYFYQGDQHTAPWLFCGDTLFAGGCGRLFEGDAPTMRHSLEQLRNLPENTEVYCAHEYTLANLRFAGAVEPLNSHIRQRTRDVEALRAKGAISLPSTLAEERRTNPFLRWDQADVVSAALGRDDRAVNDDAVFAAIRRWKDDF